MSGPAKKKPVVGNWIVRMRCEVVKEIYCADCTEEQARSNTFDYADDEIEIEQTDYTVLSVNPNE